MTEASHRATTLLVRVVGVWQELEQSCSRQPASQPPSPAAAAWVLGSEKSDRVHRAQSSGWFVRSLPVGRREQRLNDDDDDDGGNASV